MVIVILFTFFKLFDFCNSEQLGQELLAREKKLNPANFGKGCTHECMCEIPGQVPCTLWVVPPKEQRGKYWLMGKNVEPET